MFICRDCWRRYGFCVSTDGDLRRQQIVSEAAVRLGIQSLGCYSGDGSDVPVRLYQWPFSGDTSGTSLGGRSPSLRITPDDGPGFKSCEFPYSEFMRTSLAIICIVALVACTSFPTPHREMASEALPKKKVAEQY